MNYYIQKPDELYHYGIKGMRWGVRRAREASGMRRQGKTARDIVGYNVNRQLRIAKSERNRHTTAGHIVSGIGKNAVHGMIAGFALALPVAMIGGQNAVNHPAVTAGLKVAGGLLAANYAAEAGARIYYKYNTSGGRKRSNKR